ncbi:hypothetical protein EZS27_021465 [termite gut metagenome]|jgi:hypothetical protein|uniref:Uncharacterized protein n=1 Tax=termite gut metagenome TaxID=433724 RepID=A0A5J4R7T3_9ZZZZ
MNVIENETIINYIIEILDAKEWKEYDAVNCIALAIPDVEPVLKRLGIKEFHFKMLLDFEKRLSDAGYELVTNDCTTVKIEKLNNPNSIYFSISDIPPECD